IRRATSCAFGEQESMPVRQHITRPPLVRPHRNQLFLNGRVETRSSQIEQSPCGAVLVREQNRAAVSHPRGNRLHARARRRARPRSPSISSPVRLGRWLRYRNRRPSGRNEGHTTASPRDRSGVTIASGVPPALDTLKIASPTKDAKRIVPLRPHVPKAERAGTS